MIRSCAASRCWSAARSSAASSRRAATRRACSASRARCRWPRRCGAARARSWSSTGWSATSRRRAIVLRDPRRLLAGGRRSVARRGVHRLHRQPSGCSATARRSRARSSSASRAASRSSSHRSASRRSSSPRRSPRISTSRMACAWSRPNSCCAFLHALPVTRLWGVGEATRGALALDGPLDDRRCRALSGSRAGRSTRRDHRPPPRGARTRRRCTRRRVRARGGHDRPSRDVRRRHR